MEIYRSSNNFTEKTEIESTPASVRDLIDKCLDAALNRSDPKAEPSAEAWFDIVSDYFQLSIGMRSIESNYVNLHIGAPSEPQKVSSFFGFLKFIANPNAGQDILASLSKDQLVSFLDIVLTDNLGDIAAFLEPYAL
ncbi:MAG: hypothetical protein HYR70_14190 [Chloroflexi bacterium]|nr:hypothetical protein [Chloroflexota bacterium]MBI3339782.1 hypothetical protein [Chloroflexota bacterium]